MALRDIGVRTVVENLGPFLSGMDRYSAAIQRAESRTVAFAERARRTGMALTAMGGAVVALGALSVRTFATFEQSMARVGAVSQATEEELAALTDTAKEMGRTTVFSATQSAEALSFMAMAGLAVVEQIGALPQVLQLAAAGQLDLGNATDIVTNVMAGYGLTVEELARANDVLVTGFTSANTDLTQLGQAFKFAGPVAKAAGIQFEETAAALALMGNAGIQASMAGTGMRGAITRLLNPSGEAERVIAKLGLTVTDASGQMLPMADILEQLEASGLTAADAMVIFGQRAGPAMLALVEQGSAALRDLTREMIESGGTAERIAEQQLNTFSGSMTLMKSQIEGVQIAIGEALAPAIRALAEAMQPVIEGLAVMIERYPKLTAIFFAGALAITAVGVGLLAIGFILPGLVAGVGFLTGAVGFLTGSVVTLWVALGPIGWIIIGITAAVAAAILIWKNWATILSVVGELLSFIWEVLKGIVQLTVGGIMSLVSSVIPGFQEGGMSMGGPALVGERGPEIVNLPAGAVVTPMSRSTTYNVTANYANPQNPAAIRHDLEALAMATAG